VNESALLPVLSRPARRESMRRAPVRRRWWRCAPLLALSCALAGCRNTTTATKNPTAIGVGAIPGTPGYASVVQGVEMAIERLRGEGKVLQIRLPKAGSRSAVQVALQLRDDPTVLAVVGHPESGNTMEAVPIYADAEHDGANGVVVVSPTATSPRLSGISPWFFRVAPSDVDVARFAATWVLDTLRARRAAIIYRNDSYGRDWSERFASVFMPLGQIVAREPYLTGVVEWDAYAALLLKLRPDVVLFPGDADDALALIRAMHDVGLDVPFIGGDGTEAMRRDSDSHGARYVTFFSVAQASGAEAERFLARYRERYHTDPDYFAAQAYDATLALGRTASRGARTRAALRLALEHVGNAAPAIEGVGGPVGFTARHDVKSRRLVVARVDSTSDVSR
jgi:branched-chain amino acid transport system substrate-binding protein